MEKGSLSPILSGSHLEITQHHLLEVRFNWHKVGLVHSMKKCPQVIEKYSKS